MNGLKSRKRGFTLIELLIVTVVIVTLMGITFRLAGAGGDSRAKSKTLARLQRLENAISGYYAAYGSYPPVPLQGRSRDIDTEVNSLGIQGNVRRGSAKLTGSADNKTIQQIEAACRAQPVAVLFPFFMSDVDSERKSNARKLVSSIRSEKKGQFDALNNVGGFGQRLNRSSWREIQLFQFGLMSFLLPRYLFMLQGDPAMYDDHPRGQWAANNQLPCRIDSGEPYERWEDMQEILYDENTGNQRESKLIASQTSQAVCARWMPNLEGIISGGLEFYGVDTSDDDWTYLEGRTYNGIPEWGKWLRQFSKNGDYNSSGSLYLLNGMTVADGWGNEFYYYSDPPFQSYQLWSAGPNLRTFPPWLEESAFSPEALAKIRGWKSDDVKNMGN